MRIPKKKTFPVGHVRRLLEPGPVILISSAWRGRRSIMTCGWHMIMGMEPWLVGCYIWDQNESRDVIRKSRACVINVPTFDLVDTIIDIGNTHGRDIDKFDAFGLTPVAGIKVDAPLIAECHANFECKLVETSLINRFSLFVFEVVRAHVAPSPLYPQTVHYRGKGTFMVSGRNVSYRKRFKAANL